MAQYVGFSTKNACQPKTTNDVAGVDGGFGGIKKPINTGKKFRLTDVQLVLQDFFNALNTPLGQKVGQPQYGTTIWTYVFEPNTADVQFQLENEIRRVASLDPRIELNSVRAFPKENGVLVEVELAVVPFNQPLLVSAFFDGATGTAIQLV